MASLIMQITRLDEFPFYDSKAEVEVRFLKEVRKELLLSTRVREVSQPVNLASPLAIDTKVVIP